MLYVSRGIHLRPLLLTDLLMTRIDTCISLDTPVVFQPRCVTTSPTAPLLPSSLANIHLETARSPEATYICKDTRGTTEV